MALGAFLLVILPLLAFVGGSYLFSYMSYKGDNFRKEMSASVSETFGVQAEFEDAFTVSRSAVKNRKLRATGPPSSPVAAFDLTNLEARLNMSSFFSKTWTIPHLVADKAMFHLRPVAAASSTAEAAPLLLQETIKILAAMRIASVSGVSGPTSVPIPIRYIAWRGCM